WGTLASDKSNAVLVCHALTGDSHAAGHAGVGHQAVGWWDDVIGPGRALDTDELFVVCANVLGGCQGSTGPATIDPDGRPWGRRFPVVSIRDMVRAQAMVADHLGVTRWRSVVGGSMGGMQVLEWALMYPERVGSIVPIATTVAASAQQIAYSSVQRFAIALDPAFAG
ncbi:MAG: alpha/beta fold hydrolase, partial [Acidimicrobiales bacterium]|nr:alpha/beta fold hydrolase [Acidimicrobiales bacterium]